MRTLLSDLPHVEAFPTVDEVLAFADRLAVAHPDRVTVRDVGRSRGGDRIQLLTVSAANPTGSVLVIGQPHPNEPIGMVTVMQLAQQLLDHPEELDALGVDWHFVPCADPDGTRLNEGWFAGPWTREHYARHFFRPQGSAQVEWTFPFRHGDFVVDAPMPETRALMAAIDLARPQVLSSLHNAELGGAYFYATPGADALYPRLTALCTEHGIPLHLGDPETPFSVELHPAVFSVPTATQMYEMAIGIRSQQLDTQSLSQGDVRRVVGTRVPFLRQRQPGSARRHEADQLGGCQLLTGQADSRSLAAGTAIGQDVDEDACVNDQHE